MSDGEHLVQDTAVKPKTLPQHSENTCPFCGKDKIACLTDCFDINRKKICELWYCSLCGGFFPRMVVLNPGKASEAEEEDKRRNPRFPVQFVVQVDFDGKEQPKGFFGRKKEMSDPIVAMVLDAGLGGLCFRYPDAIAEGQEGRMLISLPSVARSFTAQARVVRSTKLPDGSFGLGVQFITVEPEYREALKRYVTLD